ncbi:MAG: hypothetical protein U0992_14390 [Planctomycetaceae bacterium]
MFYRLLTPKMPQAASGEAELTARYVEPLPDAVVDDVVAAIDYLGAHDHGRGEIFRSRRRVEPAG